MNENETDIMLEMSKKDKDKEDQLYDKMAKLIIEECKSAVIKYGSFHSPHEGYAIIKEEVDELWDEVKDKFSSRLKMKIEAKQIAAMAMRFMIDCEVTFKLKE